jgi:hypothetical protein
LPGGAIKIIDHDWYDPDLLTKAEINKAAGLKVYFEHASVGGNICDGIDALAAVANSRYVSGRVSWSSTYDATWYDSNDGLGDNSRGNPGADSKRTIFQASMSSALAGKVDVAMFKFCFIDSPSDAAALFASVKVTMESLEAAHPGVAFVWWTMPIETSANAERQAYNDLVRNYCKPNGKWLFDIADLESHDDAGAAVVDGSGRELLWASYSSDGGHLNALGEEKMAKAYWRLVAEIGRIH